MKVLRIKKINLKKINFTIKLFNNKDLYFIKWINMKKNL